MEEQEPSSEQPLKQKTVWNVDKIIGLSAVVVSLAACLLIAYQTFLMREQQLLSAMPHLTIFDEGTYTSNYRYVLRNHGLGPAFIEDIKITHAEKEMESKDLTAFFTSNIEGYENLQHVLYSNILPGMLIPAGSDFPIFLVSGSQDESIKLYDSLNSLFEKGMTFELIYTSVYGERWKITESSLSPEKL